MLFGVLLIITLWMNIALSDVPACGECNCIVPKQTQIGDYTFTLNTYLPPDVCTSTKVKYGTFNVDGSFMLKCNADGTGFSYNWFDDPGCNGSPNTKSLSYDANNQYWDIQCNKKRCEVLYEVSTWNSNAQCSGDPNVYVQWAYIAGICNTVSFESGSTSASLSWVWGCSDSTYTMATYSTKDCSGTPSVIRLPQGCTGAGSVSTKLKIDSCGNKGYYGIAAQAVQNAEANNLIVSENSNANKIFYSLFIIGFIMIITLSVMIV